MSATDGMPDRLRGNGETSVNAPRWLNVRELADVLGVQSDYVYRHADELGALRIPSNAGKRERLRFDLNRTRELLIARSSSERSQPPAAPAPARKPTTLQTRQHAGRCQIVPLLEPDHA